MTTTETSENVSKPYTASFRKHAHELIVWGHQQAKAAIQTDSQEEDITGFLFDAINKILRSGDCRWFPLYDVHNERPISAGGRTGKKRKLIDLLIIHLAQQGRPEYVFEAKPLNYAKPYQRTSNYTDEGGMQRFVRGAYAEYTAACPEVGMLGYVLSHTPEQWRDWLKKAIADKAQALNLLDDSQCDVAIVDELPSEWCSKHKRDSAGNPVTIYHILLDCCC